MKMEMKIAGIAVLPQVIKIIKFNLLLMTGRERPRFGHVEIFISVGPNWAADVHDAAGSHCFSSSLSALAYRVASLAE
ncbi:uncharacterized [Tachysurus ichikawai]